LQFFISTTKAFKFHEILCSTGFGVSIAAKRPLHGNDDVCPNSRASAIPATGVNSQLRQRTLILPGFSNALLGDSYEIDVFFLN
jgi:hypothetical protein